MSGRGRFVWYDLMSKDPSGAQEFYPAVTGWGLQAWDAPGGGPPYTMWAVGDQPIGGVAPLPDEAAEHGAPSHWLSYVQVEDVDETARRAEELGGTVLKAPEDIPTVGRFAVLQDPQGAVFSLFKPMEDMPPGPDAPRQGDMSWHELATSDMEAAWDFYSELFGWKKDGEHDMGDGWMYRLFAVDGKQVGGMFTKPDEMPGPPTWIYYVHVRDLDDAVATVKNRGGQVINGPMEVPGGDRIAQCLDPQGALFALHCSARA